MKNVSIIAIWGIAIFYVCTLFYYGKWKSSALITGDPSGYYGYLPAAFLYHDLKNLKITEEVAGKYKPDLNKADEMIAGTWLTNGNFVDKYSMGIAMLHLPFFLLASLVSLFLGYPVDGFSVPFQILMYLGSIFYAISGLWFLQRVMKRFFNENIIAVTLITVALGTNLYCYVTHESIMAHSYLFFLYCALLWSTLKW
ncbi:MAG: hypothetical protein ABI729_10235, partial [Chitinophagales bacterium]